jgi:hypothetical protein
MANGVVEGKCCYKCGKGEVNFKLCSQCEMLIFYECVYRTAMPLEFTVLLLYGGWRVRKPSSSHTLPFFARGDGQLCLLVGPT